MNHLVSRGPPHHKRYPWVGKDSFSHRDALKHDGAVEYNVAVQFSKSGARPRADLNRDRWIQSPEC